MIVLIINTCLNSEENVWKLCECLKEKVDLNEFHVVFISNANKQVYNRRQGYSPHVVGNEFSGLCMLL